MPNTPASQAAVCQPNPTNDDGMVTSELRRLGDVEKCPACGSPVDPCAYHCTKCRRDFCFHCRVPMVDADQQYYCTNQACSYHGKLLCATCDPEVKKEEPPLVYSEYESGWWPFLLMAGILVSLLTYIFGSHSFWTSTGIGLGTAALVAFGLHRAKVNVFGKENRLEQSRTSIYHTCISCKQSVRELL